MWSITRREIAPLLQTFDIFDPEIMKKRPADYVSEMSTGNGQGQSDSWGLLEVVRISRGYLLDSPETRFPKRNEAALAAALTVAQQLPARIFRTWKRCQAFSERRTASGSRVSPRWLAAFDLSMGTVLAHQVRAASYNEACQS